MDILRFVWMLIGSEITYGDALSILYEVQVKGNHSDGDKGLQKKSGQGENPVFRITKKYVPLNR